MTKIFLFLFIILQSIAHSQTQLEAGLMEYEAEGVTTVVTDIALSPDGSKLFLAGLSHRAYLYNVSSSGAISPAWKNSNTGSVVNGSLASFSANGNYIALQGFLSSTAVIKNVIWSKYKKAWQNTDEMCVLDAATGSTLFKVKDAYSISISGNTAFVSDKDGFKWYSLPDGKEIKAIKIEDNEYAAISPSGKYIIESWDADKEAMKNIASVLNRKSELKNAYRAKKLIAIYSADNLQKPIAISDDEVDVVTHIDFDLDENYVYIQTQQGGEETNNTFTTSAYQRIEIKTGKIDKNFGYKGNYSKLNANGTVSSLFTGGDLGLKKQIRIQDPNHSENFSSFSSKFKLFKVNTIYSPMVFIPNTSSAFVYYDKKIYTWDYNIVRSYFKKAAELGQEELVEKLNESLDNNIESGDLKKDIAKKGIIGDYIMDITVVGPKCAVQTIFCESDDNTNIKMQNDLKEIIKKIKFDIELPKDRRAKFRYTFHL
jgi:WD40 repeat protein